MLEAVYPWMHLGGRILFSAFFIATGLSHLLKLDQVAGAAQAKGVPMAKLWTVGMGLIILAGGLMILLGWRRFIGAGLIVIFSLLSAVMMHAFWKEKDPIQSANEAAHFWKNVAMAGGALLIASYAGWSWPLSLGG